MANLRMKQIEYRIKKNFYSNEQIVSDVYNGIGKESTQCFSKAYSSILSQTINDGGKVIYQSEDDAFEAFSRNFMARLTDKFEEGTQKDDTLERLNNYSIYSAVSTKVKQYDEIEVINNSKGVPTELVIRGIVVNYKETDNGGITTGYESSITTDIVIEVPYVTFFEDSSRILDYALIGNKGVYFRDGNRDVTGNVYAGTDSDEPLENITDYRNEDVYGGLNFYKAGTNMVSSYIISKGDINVRDCTVDIGIDADSDGETQVWAETLRTVEDRDRNKPIETPIIRINGQTFIANDLELNARNSNVELAGEYYGYNDNKYITQEKNHLMSPYETEAHTQSSSVIVNGNNSTLDLSGLDMFVVAGVAYIDFANSNFPEGGKSGIEEYATGESLALKSNQYIYLAPQECLTGMNPCLSEEEVDVTWVLGSNWFAYDKGYIDKDEPIDRKIYGRNGKKYVYHYLNFIDDVKKNEYTKIVLNMTEPDKMDAEMPEEIKSLYEKFNDIELEQIWEVKEAAQARATAASVISNISVADDVDARIYTKGNIVQVNGDKESTLHVDSERLLSDEYVSKIINNLLKHYQHFYTYLDPKEDFSLLSDTLVKVTDAELSDYTKPFSKFVDADKIIASYENEYKCTGKYGKCKTIISKENYTITNNLSGIVICNGDVTVDSGVQVEGLILSAGRIYLKGNGNVEAGRAVIQNMIDEEYSEEEVKEDGEERNLSYASTYLKDYGAKQKGAVHKDRITGTDYTDYISYRNWKKGEGN